MLDLQALDTRLDQIAHTRARLPQAQRVVEVTGAVEETDRALVEARTALSDVQRELDKAERDVQVVRDRAARNSARLDAGTGSAKDLQAIQHELQSLARRQADLEEVELEVMERAETLEGDVTRLEGSQAALAADLEEAVRLRDEALADLDAQVSGVAGERKGVVADLPGDLLALYDRIRADRGGVAAAELRQRRCGGCQLELNHQDLAQIAAADADAVIRCEECRRILVRTGESGL